MARGVGNLGVHHHWSLRSVNGKPPFGEARYHDHDNHRDSVIRGPVTASLASADGLVPVRSVRVRMRSSIAGGKKFRNNTLCRREITLIFFIRRGARIVRQSLCRDNSDLS